jgi:hypothetical protein
MILTLSACSGTQVRSTTKAIELDDKAIVILSVSHDAGAGNGANAIFYLDETRYPGRVVIMSRQDTFSIPTASDFKNRRGHLYVLELEPGRHQIDGWQVTSGGIRIVAEKAPEPLEFEVHKGDVLYLGNLHAKLSLGLRGLGGRMANDASAVVADQHEQDLALAEEKTPALKGRVRIALLAQDAWDRGGQTVRRMDSVVPFYLPKK